jgi:hypothetical protein
MLTLNRIFRRRRRSARKSGNSLSAAKQNLLNYNNRSVENALSLARQLQLPYLHKGEAIWSLFECLSLENTRPTVASKRDSQIQMRKWLKSFNAQAIRVDQLLTADEWLEGKPRKLNYASFYQHVGRLNYESHRGVLTREQFEQWRERAAKGKTAAVTGSAHAVRVALRDIMDMQPNNNAAAASTAAKNALVPVLLAQEIALLSQMFPSRDEHRSRGGGSSVTFYFSLVIASFLIANINMLPLRLLVCAAVAILSVAGVAVARPTRKKIDRTLWLIIPLLLTIWAAVTTTATYRKRTYKQAIQRAIRNHLDTTARFEYTNSTAVASGTHDLGQYHLLIILQHLIETGLSDQHTHKKLTGWHRELEDARVDARLLSGTQQLTTAKLAAQIEGVVASAVLKQAILKANVAILNELTSTENAHMPLDHERNEQVDPTAIEEFVECFRGRHNLSKCLEETHETLAVKYNKYRADDLHSLNAKQQKAQANKTYHSLRAVFCA